MTWSGGSYGTCAIKTCDSDFHNELGTCTSNTKTVSCTTGQNPTNSTEATADVEVTWNE
jgi:hypothetical protein